MQSEVNVVKPVHSIVITTGMTGGHFFPALSFAESYLTAHPESQIHFLLPRGNSKFDLAKYQGKLDFHCIPVEPFPRAFSLKLFSFLVHYLSALRQTWQFVLQTKPKVLVSFGSYGSFPGVLCAWSLRVPIVIHEQNRISGWANRCAVFFAKWIAISFPDTSGIALKEKIKLVGYPLRHEIIETARKKIQNTNLKKRCTILVLGGSQGAQAINRTILEVFDKLSVEEKEKLAVIHITGEAQFADMLERYRLIGIQHQIYAFSDEMHRWYEEADLVVSRSGAGTIFELMAFGLPAILVPYPFAHSHQMRNAKYAEEQGFASVIEQKDLTADRLKRELMQLISKIEKKEQTQKLPQKPMRQNVNQVFVKLVEQLT